MNKRPGLAFVICAPSGAGKTTLVRRLIKDYPNFTFSVSCTTREPREGETQGRDYDFISKEEFKKRRDEGFFAEWAEVHGHFYGSPLGTINELLSQGSDLLFDIDIQGAEQLKHTIGDSFFVFVLPPSREELKKRLMGRGTESEESLSQRLGNARKEIASADWFDAFIVNDNLDEAYEELKAAFVAATLTPRSKRRIVKEILEGWDGA